MTIVLTNETVAGAVAAALVAALAASRLFRAAGLVAVAALACAAYVPGGLDGLVATADGLADDLAAQADFANDLAVGGVFTLILAAALRLGGRGRDETPA